MCTRDVLYAKIQASNYLVLAFIGFDFFCLFHFVVVSSNCTVTSLTLSLIISMYVCVHKSEGRKSAH